MGAKASGGDLGGLARGADANADGNADSPVVAARGGEDGGVMTISRRTQVQGREALDRDKQRINHLNSSQDVQDAGIRRVSTERDSSPKETTAFDALVTDSTSTSIKDSGGSGRARPGGVPVDLPPSPRAPEAARRYSSDRVGLSEIGYRLCL